MAAALMHPAEKGTSIQHRLDRRLDVARRIDRVVVRRGQLLAVTINDGCRKTRTTTKDGCTIDAYEARELPLKEESLADTLEESLYHFYRIGGENHANVHDLLSVTLTDDGSGKPASVVVYEENKP